MLTRLKIENFKRLEQADIELGPCVVFVGPNNSGKTSALQALALWEIGMRQWNAKRQGKVVPTTRPGVTINRRDLLSIPIPAASLLWHDLHTREQTRNSGKPGTRNVLISVTVEGVTRGTNWQCGFEFDYGNEESFYCRPLRIGGDRKSPLRMPIPDEARDVRIGFLPPMSGLASTEPKWEAGRINVLLGEGQTAQVLRNLCHTIWESSEDHTGWKALAGRIESLFGAKLRPPVFIQERGEITMEYEEPGVPRRLDLSSTGRGLQQTLLLLAYLYANPGAVLLLDEPDAHLEILRQRQIYQLINEVAEELDSQIIAASHSEIILNEAADRDVVVAFVGAPHRIDDRGSQVVKSLKEIGFEHYYAAEQRGWVVYLEGSNDLAVLRALARKLEHPAASLLERPYVHYVGNVRSKARDHFFGLREAKRDLVGVALFDRDDWAVQDAEGLSELMWRRREIENYLCREEVLLRYARHSGPDELWDHAEQRVALMHRLIGEIAQAKEVLGEAGPWSPDIKASSEFLDRLFQRYFKERSLPNLMTKRDYHVLAEHIQREEIDPEITEKLDAIVRVAQKAHPCGV